MLERDTTEAKDWTLLERSRGRENNLNTLRLIFASMVLLAHSFPVLQRGSQDFFSKLFASTNIAEMGVNAFFVVSGFLIVKSINRNDIVYYTSSRILRIYPALIVCTLLTILVMAAYSTLPAADYFTDNQTKRFLNNMHLSKTVIGRLPGVFENMNIEVVNVSLWTLVVELRCYLIVGVLGVLGIFRNRLFGSIAILVMLAMIWTDIGPNVPLIHEKDPWHRVFSFFMIGGLAYLNRDVIRLDARIFVFSLLAFWFLQGTPNYDLMNILPFAYIVLYLAYGPRFRDVTEGFGDISYGLYIYAFPVQQALGASFPSISPYLHAVVSLAITTVLAKLSWELIEKHALRMKWVPSQMIDRVLPGRVDLPRRDKVVLTQTDKVF